MTPTTCTFSPCGEPAPRANRKIAPAVIRKMPVPVPMPRLAPAAGCPGGAGPAEVVPGRGAYVAER